MNNSKIFGYARVSSKEQNLDRQLKALSEFGIEERNIFQDKMSGKDTNRPQYQALRTQLREGDLVVVQSLDRLGRNYDDVKAEWEYITRTVKADIKVLDMEILDTRNKDKDLIGKVITDVVLNLLSYVAETERAKIRERQAQGIEIAKKEGKFKKTKIQAPENFKELFEKAVKGDITHTQAMKELNLNKTTYYRIAKELGLTTNKRETPTTRK